MRAFFQRNHNNIFYIVFLGLIIIWMGYIIINGKGGILRKNELEEKIIKLESEIKELEHENTFLDIKIENLSSNKRFIQGYARELGYKNDGDLIYKFIKKNRRNQSNNYSPN